jgi:hypothetical protein
MSSLHDPFDLIKTDKNMDNVIPLLPTAKINQMIEKALACQQVSPLQKKPIFLSHKSWWSGGAAATAACLLLFMSLSTAPQQAQLPIQVAPHTVTLSQTDQTDDMSEFSELVMLETLEKY